MVKTDFNAYQRKKRGLTKNPEPTPPKPKSNRIVNYASLSPIAKARADEAYSSKQNATISPSGVVTKRPDVQSAPIAAPQTLAAPTGQPQALDAAGLPMSSAFAGQEGMSQATPQAGMSAVEGQGSFAQTAIDVGNKIYGAAQYITSNEAIVGGTAGFAALMAGSVILPKIASAIFTPVGGLTVIKASTWTSKGTKAVVQTNTKTRGLFGNILSKLMTSTNTITTTSAKGLTATRVVQTSGLGKPLVIAGATLGALAYIAEKTYGGKNFAGFLGKEEASQAAGIAVWMAQASDNDEAYWESRDLQNEILDKVDGTSSLMPFKNVADGIKDYADAAKKAGAIMDKIMIDKANDAATGLSDVDAWKQRDIEKAAMEKANIDYYNQQKQIYLQMEFEARRNNREDEAEFWAESAAKQRELEAEDREAIALFWLEYKKMVALMYENNRPSKLNFGGIV